MRDQKRLSESDLLFAVVVAIIVIEFERRKNENRLNKYLEERRTIKCNNIHIELHTQTGGD